MPDLFLRKIAHHSPLGDDDRQALIDICHRGRRFAAHEDLIQEHEEPDFVNIVIDGWACRYKVLEDGRRQIVAIFVPGDMCDPAVFLLREMSYALAALTTTTVARLSRNDMVELSASRPALARAFSLDMLLMTEIQREWTVSLGRRTASERLAHLFCELPLRLKTVGLSNGLDCELPLVQADLADVLGLTAVHLNRTLQDLRKHGLVEMRSRRLSILDEKALRALAMFDPGYLHLPPE